MNIFTDIVQRFLYKIYNNYVSTFVSFNSLMLSDIMDVSIVLIEIRNVQLSNSAC